MGEVLTDMRSSFSLCSDLISSLIRLFNGVHLCVLAGLETQAASPTPKANPRPRKHQDMDSNAEVLHYSVY